MSQMTDHAVGLEWDLQDRLAKSLRRSKKSVAQIAADLDVHRNTVSNYLSGRIVPDRRSRIAWAMATGVPPQWLETGEMPSDGGGGNDGQRVNSTAGTVSNRYPFGHNGSTICVVDELYLEQAS
jgi:transcriptional regulator with XRE-family HTH domain